MKRQMNKALAVMGLSFSVLVTSIAPSMTTFAAIETGSVKESSNGTNLALTASASAAYTNTYLATDAAGKVNDGELATTDPATSWNCWGAAEEKYPMEVKLTWDAPQTMRSTRVVWWADGGGVTWPGGASLYYLNGEDSTWVQLPDVGAEHGDTASTNEVWNIVNFENEITTTSLKLMVNRGSGYNGIGISEWEVYADKLQEVLIGATVTGNTKIALGTQEVLTGTAKPATLAEEVTYAWSIQNGADCIELVGDTDKNTVTVKGIQKGNAKLKLTVTKDDVVKETEVDVRVTNDEIDSIDTYKTSTAAGVAPILPDSVVANGIQFDDPTTSTLAQYGYEYAESFGSKLVPVVWEKVDPAAYSEEQIGKTFTVNGKVTYNEVEYAAKAEITVANPVTAGSSNSSVTFENVQLEDNFWLEKQETNATASLNKAITEIEKATGGEPNFDNAIKKLNGEAYDAFSGFVFQDSDIYKSIEAISYTLSATKNETSEEMVAQREKLAAKVNTWIEKIEKVQYADGYIDTFFTLRSESYSGGGKPGTHRFWEMSNHELYNAGHFLEAVVAYTRYREGINDPDYRLYVAGKRFADDIVRLFGPDGTRYEVPGHEEVELALVKFGKLAEEYEGEGAGQKYYDTAKTLIDRRGQNKDLRNTGYNGGTYSQDATPFASETNAVGHSVRATYFYTGVTDIATLLPESNEDRANYINSLDTIWNSVTEKKTYITGGIGTTTAGSDSEGFGKDYDLPPDQSYCEICAAIGSANWNQRMNLLHEDGKYADMVETNLYNSILVGTNLDGNRFFYSTRLAVDGGNSRSEWFSCACCPPNIMRTIAALGGYMYNVHNDTVFVNMYAGSSSNIDVGGTKVGMKQETNYPWDGAVKMTVTPESDKEFTLKIRIPGWVGEQKNKDVTIKVNGEIVTAQAENGYVAINKTWTNGDVVDIDMPMEIRLTESNENVEATQGQIAIERGPIVYCIEKAGNAQLNTEISDFDPLNFVIPRNAELTATYNEDLLKGVVEITGDVKYTTGNGDELIDAKLQAVPYYAWNNRGDDGIYEEGLANPKNNSSKMEIWAWADKAVVKEKGLRDYATPSVNHVGWGMGADLFADGKEGTFWNGHNDTDIETRDQWMMYDFGDKKAEITASDILFYDDNGGVMVPQSIKIEYTDDAGNWVEVTPKGQWSYSKTEVNTYEFEKIVTSKIRVTMNHSTLNGSKIGVAVKEWGLTGNLVGESGETANKETLDQNIKLAEGKVEKDYTAESWQVYIQALANAKQVAAKENATQEEIDAANAALQSAIAGLKQASATKPGTNPNPTVTDSLKNGDEVTVKNVVYKVTDAAKKEATAYKAANKSLKTLRISNTVVIKGETCKVVSISASAFTGMKKLTKVTIPKNVTSIGAKAFYNDKKLKSVKINCTSPKSIGKYAFKGIDKKATIDVANKQLKKYKKLLKKAKTANTVKIK